jgi:hypothetical protein
MQLGGNSRVWQDSQMGYSSVLVVALFQLTASGSSSVPPSSSVAVAQSPWVSRS